MNDMMRMTDKEKQQKLLKVWNEFNANKNTTMEEMQYVKNRVKNICCEFGDGETEFNTRDITKLHNQLEIEEEQNEMLIAELSRRDNELVKKFENDTNIETFKKLTTQIKELLDVIEDTKNAYAWWMDEKGGEAIEFGKSDYEHYEKMKELLIKNGRPDH